MDSFVRDVSVKIANCIFTNVQGVTGQLSRTATRMATTKEGPMMSKYLTKFWKDQSGATAIEYGLIAAGISIAIIAAVQATGTSLKTTFTSVSTALK